MFHKAVANIIFGAMWLLSLLPLRVHYVISDIMRFFLHRVVRYRYTTVITNLSRCFPELHYGEIRKIAREYYRYVCDIIVENVWSLSMDNREFHRRFYIDNPEIADELFKTHEKIIVVMGHRGNWELIGGFGGYWKERKPESFGWQPIWVGYKRTRNKIMNDLVIKIRLHEYKHLHIIGNIIESHNFLRTILKKDNRGVYVFIADQSPKDARTVVKFLGRPTLMFNGAAHLAHKMNVPVVFLDIARQKRGQYLMHFTTISEFPKEMECDEIVRRYASLLESAILSNPHNWLWSHKRWKRDLTEEEREIYNSLR